MTKNPPDSRVIGEIKGEITNMDTNSDIYRRIHFAVMAIESGARKLGIDWIADDISETLLNWEAGL